MPYQKRDQQHTSILSIAICSLAMLAAITSTLILSNSIYKRMSPSMGPELALIIGIAIAVAMLFMILLTVSLISEKISR